MILRPIPDHRAIRRLTDAGLDLAQAYDMPDSALLSFPSIGRRTLAWVRAHAKQGLDARTKKLSQEAADALLTLARHALSQETVRFDPLCRAEFVTIEPTDVLGDMLCLALHNVALAAGRTPHHREADALYGFAENVRWASNSPEDSAPDDDEEEED